LVHGSEAVGDLARYGEEAFCAGMIFTERGDWFSGIAADADARVDLLP